MHCKFNLVSHFDHTIAPVPKRVNQRTCYIYSLEQSYCGYTCLRSVYIATERSEVYHHGRVII